MVTDNAGLGSWVVVVGDPNGELVSTMRRWAREGEIDAVTCDDVYAAVARIAQAAGRRVLVVGRMRDLARENDVFFRIAAAHAICCCCLLDQTGPSLRAALLAVLQAGVTVVDSVPDVRRILQEWLGTLAAPDSRHAAREAAPVGGRARAAPEASYAEFRATEAELSALLG
jgi:hypothetical protein